MINYESDKQWITVHHKVKSELIQKVIAFGITKNELMGVVSE